MTVEEPQRSHEKISAVPIEALATFPLPGMTVPTSITFSPDDQFIAYLWSPDASLVRHLYRFDLESQKQVPWILPPDEGVTEENLPPEEKLRRERQRQRGLGISLYRWSGRTSRLLVPLRGHIYVQDEIEETALRQVAGGDSHPLLDPRFSPDGNWIAYVQDSELYVIPTAGGQPRQLTHGARETGKSNGLAEFVAQEEMNRSRGFWWSPDSRWLAFVEVDENHIPLYRIVHQGKDQVGPDAQEDHRYPFAGQANARVRLGVISRDGGSPVWMDLGEDEDIYLARVNWLPDGRLTAQRLNRQQTQLDLLCFDIETGQSHLLLQEHSDVWINLHSLFRPLKDGRFIWASERSGFQHLYLYAADGQLIRNLTSGQWLVDGIAGIDQIEEIVYFTGTRQAATEGHLYAVSFSGGQVRQLTTEAGMHSVVLDHSLRRFADLHQALDRPPTLTLRALADGQAICSIFEEVDPRIDELGLAPPELVSLPNRHGDQLYGAVYRPPAHFGQGPFPTIVSVYGGPHAQRVTHSWDMTANMRAQYLRSLGYLVFILDNRGSARRGLQFEAVIKHNMGEAEVEDQVDGVGWLVAEGLANPRRVGIYGWSYGGYMALMCLAKASATFRVGVAGAPVAHWDGYDTCYTERYMGTPQSNPQGYRQSSVLHHVPAIQGHLMLVHGLIDENVHFRHTARLINALIQARKTYDLLLFPDERHGPRRPADRIYLEERITSFIHQHLSSSASPAD